MGQVAVEDEVVYRQMIDSITEYAVIRLDQEGRIRTWHPGAERLTGYSAEEILGHPVSRFYTDDDARGGQTDREMSTAARVGRYETEGWRVRKDGTKFWSNVVISPIRDETGELVGFVKVARDLTERREQEQLLARQRDEI